MNIEFLIYLIGIVDHIIIMTMMMTGVLISGCIVILLIGLFDSDPDIDMSLFKKILINSTIVMVIAFLIPDSKTITAIATVHYGKEFVNSDNNELVKLRKLLNIKLDEYLKDQP